MDKFVIRGGKPVEGQVVISGAKNAALPALAAALLTDKKVILDNVPAVRDLQTMARLLTCLGAEVDFGEAGRKPNRVTIQTANITGHEAPYELVKTMRASSLVLGPLLARFGCARVSMPGGCAIGARPIDLHIKGLEKLGAFISQEHGYIEAQAPAGLKGANVYFSRITVTGTEDLIMAAVLADGETVLENAAREPEVVDLAEMLNKMGAQIEGAGTSTIRIKGVGKLKGTRHTIIPDRIEAGTFLAAAAITGGQVLLERCNPAHFAAVVAKVEEAGAEVSLPSPSSIEVRASNGLTALEITTAEYPGFATDMQAQFAALMTQAEGTSIITETIFENRFLHVPELARMGAQIRVEGNRAIVLGRSPLSGAAVLCSDLRASASLILAGLVARGETLVDRVYHVDRGYERIEEKLRSLGADIRRVSGSV